MTQLELKVGYYRRLGRMTDTRLRGNREQATGKSP